MAASNRSRLRLLAAEIRGELQRIAQTVSEIETAKAEVEREGAPRLALYGAAALLETFDSFARQGVIDLVEVQGGSAPVLRTIGIDR